MGYYILIPPAGFELPPAVRIDAKECYYFNQSDYYISKSIISNMDPNENNQPITAHQYSSRKVKHKKRAKTESVMYTE